MKKWTKLLALVLSLSMLLSMAACTGDAGTESTGDTTPSTTAPAGTEQTTPSTGETEPITPDEPDDDIGEYSPILLDENGRALLSVSESADAGNALPFRVLSAEEMVAEMGTGWNLGNTMDGHSGFTPNETLWQDVQTTQGLIDAVHDLGFNTVRIPITWGTMINEDYSINEKWIGRVQDIVDYCINQDMYVIINIHHDGAEQSGWLRVATDDLDSLYQKYAGVWTTIANYFRDYDEHLIFESMNEVTGDTTTSVQYDTEIIMNLNQIFVNVVRSSGSNNAFRWLSVPGRYTNTEHMTNEKYGFDLPEDTRDDRIFAAVHWYNWAFAMNENTTYTEFKDNMVQELVSDFEKLVNRFTSQGIPVIMGEYGVINKNNPEQRAYHNEIFNLLAKNSGVVPVYWDQGWYDRTLEPADYSFALVDRVTYQSIDKEVTDGLMRGFFADSALGMNVDDITVSPVVTPVSALELAQSEVTLTIGQTWQASIADVQPEGHNDVLLWKTADYNVATVYNGMIYARGIGSTTITVFSQSGSIEATLTVTVNALEGEATVTTEADSYELTQDQSCNIGASLSSTVDGDYLTYVSSDPSVATVNKLGKIVAVGVGSAKITVRAASGAEKTVTVTVSEKTYDQVLNLALNVLFNDNDLGCFNNETGPVIQIYEDGQYTVTFDIATDLSDATAAMGVTGLNNLTAIYIKDYDVTVGNLKKSNLTSCLIRWDSVVVDGVELTLNTNEFKSAIKSSGIFDTNDPFNSWDGSAVEEVTVTSYVLNILLDNPQTVSITFTISGLEFAE